jgi:acetoin:2,6-dichlorophenolindophenol oxidoreductase subunit beta
MAHIVKHGEAAERLEHDGISAEAIDVRSLVPLDMSTLLESVAKTGRFFTVEENPHLALPSADRIYEKVAKSVEPGSGA